jgi:hypothetical protein
MSDANEPNMRMQFETPTWTFLGWLWGVVGFLAATAYLMGWYFIFAAPLILAYFVLSLIISSFAESTEVALIVLSPLALWFLMWQVFCFVGPACLELLRSVGLFLQRAHCLTPSSAIAVVRQRRVCASHQLLNLMGWLFRKI